MNKIVNSIIMVAGIVAVAVILGLSYTYKYRVQNTVTITGLGETEFTSDLIVWRGHISAENWDPATGYANLEESKGKVLEFITSRGVPADSVSFMFVDVTKLGESIYSDEGKYMGQRFAGYRLRQEFVVESSDVDAVEAISREISSLIADGVQMELRQPAYYYSQLDGLKLDLIEEATIDARERAQRIAQQSGGHLGAVKNARTGVFQITGANDDEEFTAGGSFNTSSRHKKARITVRLEYRVN